MILINDYFDSKTTCDPKFKKMEGGNDICRTSLNDFCQDTEDNNIPNLIKFTDDKQTEIKHKRCDIDFKKIYPSDYEKMLKSTCNDYDSGFNNPDNKKDALRTNKRCIDFCKKDMKQCDKGMKKYCTQKYGDTKNPQIHLFDIDCEEYLLQQPDYDSILEKYCVLDSTSPVYNNEKCTKYRTEYNKCLKDNKYKGSMECDNFYNDNPNVTAIIFNTECDKNPNFSYCNKKIKQKDMYKNTYQGSPNEREASKNIINSDPSIFFKTSEENIINTQKSTVDSKINEEKMNYCLDNINDPNCKKLMDNYMKNDFIKTCIKGRKDAFDNIDICKKIKQNKNINFSNTISPYCLDKESSVYGLGECANIVKDNDFNDILKKTLIIGIPLIIVFIIWMIVKKYIFK
jgi:hypothetical protein